jgi:hypothetical protein
MSSKKLSMIPEGPCREKTVELCSTERPRYFPRQLITPSDLTLEAEYFRNKLRRHNRLMHGWGVVCGALVCPVWKVDGTGLEPWKVMIKSGYILAPFGDEISIEQDRKVDLRTSGVTVAGGEPGGEIVDPWCSEVFVKRESGPLYVAVKYKEVMTRPVRVQPVGCSCDDSQCEYSRWCDGYEVGVLTCCPDSHKKKYTEPSPKLADLIGGSIPACFSCPSDPWVVLAKVEIDRCGEISHIDNCSCRRLVISHGGFWWQCASVSCEMEVKGGDFQQDAKDIEVEVKGSGIQQGAKADLGGGVTIEIDDSEEGYLKFKANIAADALPGYRALTILNPDCTLCRKEEAITISADPQKTAKKPSSKEGGE